MSYSLSLLAAFTADKADMKKVYDTANFYHFIHTVALLAVPLSRKPVLVSSGFLNLGHCIFKVRRLNLLEPREPTIEPQAWSSDFLLAWI